MKSDNCLTHRVRGCGPSLLQSATCGRVGGLETMNGSNPCGPSSGFRAPSPKRGRPGLRVSCSPSPYPAMVGMARCAVPARVAAGGTNIRATLPLEGVAPLHAARTSQRDVPTPLNMYVSPVEGETFARALVMRPSLIAACLRNKRQRSGDCNSNIRIFQRGANSLPLLRERAGMMGNEATSNPRRTTTSGTVKFLESPGTAEVSHFD